MKVLANFLLWIIVVAIFWFLLMRPQKKKQQQHQQMLEALKVGDNVITIGGIKGEITTVDEGELKLQIAPEVEIDISKRAISQVDNNIDTANSDNEVENSSEE